MIHIEGKPNYISSKSYNEIVNTICLDYGYALKNITCVFLTDEELLKINQEYLKHDYYTDIITFDLSEKENTLEGELYISVERVSENAHDYKSSVINEMYRVMIHGILHLVGLGDKTEEEQIEIRKKENEYLTLLK